MRRNKTKKAFALLALALVFALVLSLAYFTDRAELTVSVTGGTVVFAEDATANWKNQLQAGPDDPLDNINPGDSRSLAFTVTNEGNKAIDVRHTIKLTVEDANGNAKQLTMGEDVNGVKMLQFDIFRASDVEYMSNDSGNAGYVLADNAVPVFSTNDINKTTMMGANREFIEKPEGTIVGVYYYFADTILDGTGKEAEIGYALEEQVDTYLASNTSGKNDILLSKNDTAVTYEYVLIFRDTALNDFQGCVVHLDLVIEAKQHLNTNSSWEHIETVSYELASSGVEAQKTAIDTAPNAQTGVLENVKADTAGSYNGHGTTNP